MRVARHRVLGVKMDRESTGEVVLRGLITATDWSDLDITEISIFTEDEDRFVIADSNAGSELFEYIRSFVEVKGNILEKDSDRKILVVTGYRIIQEGDYGTNES